MERLRILLQQSRLLRNEEVELDDMMGRFKLPRARAKRKQKAESSATNDVTVQPILSAPIDAHASPTYSPNFDQARMTRAREGEGAIADIEAAVSGYPINSR